MTQLTFDSFPREEQTVHEETSVMVLIFKDFNIAWIDRNWYLHVQDLVYLDEKLATILIARGIARKAEI
jgi:DNA replication initiation complex subunit (GINS family)